MNILPALTKHLQQHLTPKLYPHNIHQPDPHTITIQITKNNTYITITQNQDHLHLAYHPHNDTWTKLPSAHHQPNPCTMIMLTPIDLNDPESLTQLEQTLHQYT